MKSIVCFSTQTSATDSMWRIFTTIDGNRRKHLPIVIDYLDDMESLKDAVLPTDGELIGHNAPRYFNKNLDFERYRFIINYRDPRDRLCNMFQWQMVVHPSYPGESAEQIEKRTAKVQNIGIDKWILSHIDINYYDTIFYLIEHTDAKERLILTYARLCLDFDSFIAKSAKFLNVTLTSELRKKLEPERVENLHSNDHWVGNRWPGCDTMPGRYKRELQPETIDVLNQRFKPILRKMAKYDPDYGHLYLEGIE